MGQRQTGFVAVPSIFVQHALADGAIDRGKRGLQQIPGGRGIAGGNRGAEPLHQCAHTSAVRAIHISSLA